MCKIGETEILDRRRRNETQLEMMGRAGTELEIRAVETPGQDAAALAVVGAAKNALAAVIPVRWMPEQVWPKTIRVVKSLHS